jgi:tetratricopeptide (TPR) repeat protein
MMAETTAASGHVDRVVALFESNDWEALADAAIARDWSDTELAALDSALGDHESASIWERWGEAEDRGGAFYAMGFVVARTGRAADAVEQFLAANALGDYCDVELGEEYSDLGDWTSAEASYRRALTARRDEWEYSRAAYRLGEHAFEIDDRTDAEVVALLEAGVAEADEAVVLLSRLHERRGDVEGARHVLEDAFATNEYVPLALGNLLSDVFEEYPAAQAAYEEGFRRGDAYSAYNLAIMLENDLGRLEEATEWFRKAAVGGDAAARARLSARGEEGWDEPIIEEDGATAPAWMHALYDNALLPYLHSDILPDKDRRPVFRIGPTRAVPPPGVIVRAGRLGLPILIEPHPGGFDLATLGSGITAIRDLTIADAASVTGWDALVTAIALEEIDLPAADPPAGVDYDGMMERLGLTNA